MNILTRSSFDRAFKKLGAADQSEIRAAAARLPDVFGDPHTHSALGIRRFGGFFEFRAGLKLRVLFLLDGGDIVLVTVGNHDDIRRLVKENS